MFRPEQKIQTDASPVIGMRPAEQILEKNLDELTDPEEIERVLNLIESDSDYRLYHQPDQITYESLMKLTKEVETKLRDQKVPEQTTEGLTQVLKETIDDLQRDCQHYHSQILRQERLAVQSQRGFLDQDKYIAQQEMLDVSRRNTHNNILANLRLLARLCYGPNLASSQLPSLPELGIILPPRKTFPLEELNDEQRNVIGDWAFSAALGYSLNQIKQ